MRIFALALGLSVALVAPRARAHELSELKSRGELVWGGDLQGGAPYVFEDERGNGAIRGFEVDIARALARRLGVRARFAQNDWSNLVRGRARELGAADRGPLTLVLVTHETALASELATERWTLSQGKLVEKET